MMRQEMQSLQIGSLYQEIPIPLETIQEAVTTLDAVQAETTKASVRFGVYAGTDITAGAAKLIQTGDYQSIVTGGLQGLLSLLMLSNKPKVDSHALREIGSKPEYATPDKETGVLMAQVRTADLLKETYELRSSRRYQRWMVNTIGIPENSLIPGMMILQDLTPIIAQHPNLAVPALIGSIAICAGSLTEAIKTAIDAHKVLKETKLEKLVARMGEQLPANLKERLTGNTGGFRREYRQNVKTFFGRR